ITDAPPAIPEGTTALGNWALAGFDGLADVVIPDSVQTVGFGAFSGCDSMTSLTIPVAGVTLNGYLDWMKLLFITEFTVDVGQEYAIPTGLKTIRLTGNMTDLPGATFDGFVTLETVVLPDTLQTIGVNAFNGCAALSNVNIPVGVTKIGDYAFQNTALVSIDLPDGLLEIGKFAFAKTKLTEIVLPESLQIVQRGAFAQCDRVASLTTPVLKVIFNRGTSMEAYDGLQYLFESYDIGSAGEILCDVPDTLKTVHVIGNMTEFPVYDYDGPFYGFDSLTTVTLPNTLQSIGDYAFNGCGALTTVNIPAGVTEIGDFAFKNCSMLGAVQLPTGLQTIGAQAFNGCSALTSINIPEGVTKIDMYAFTEAGLTSVHIPASMQVLDYGVFLLCESLESVTFAANATLTIGGSAFAGCSKLTELEIPSTVASVECGAFAGCTSLEKLTMPLFATASCRTDMCMGHYHNQFRRFFSSDDIGGIANPTALSVTFTTGTAIPERYFEGMTGIIAVELPSTVTEIGAYAFSGCTALANVHFAENEGWRYENDSVGTALSGTDLENTATAATYLKTTYVSYRWKRS
ncbi:MAG: leucine-rich repeat domain-containing protein, partial [Clostridia bacterium]|nr:leucine-rich repeat domain-containing protein [Clostridia bacterium]